MQLRGSKRIKKPGTRQQLCLIFERTSDGFDRKAFRREFVKQAAGLSSGLWKIKILTCGGVDPLWSGRKPTSSICIRRAREVGAPATRDNFSPLLEKKKREKRGKPLDDGDILD
jgi:hypothetical protein